MIPPWGLWSISGVLALGGAWLLWWSLLRDRSRGRRRCPKCWYDLSHTSGLRCSECGHEARRERSLFRTRRRWRVAMLGALCWLILTGIMLWPSIRRGEWARWMPTTTLIATFDWSGDDWALNELQSRLSTVADRLAGNDAGLWDWQEAWLAAACVRSAHAGSDAAQRGAVQLALRSLSDRSRAASAFAECLESTDWGVVSTTFRMLDGDPDIMWLRSTELVDAGFRQLGSSYAEAMIGRLTHTGDAYAADRLLVYLEVNPGVLPGPWLNDLIHICNEIDDLRPRAMKVIDQHLRSILEARNAYDRDEFVELRHSSETVTTALAASIGNDRLSTRHLCETWLTTYGQFNEESTRLLLKAIDHPDGSTRMTALRILGTRRPHPEIAVPWLESTLSHYVYGVRDLAEWALEQYRTHAPSATEEDENASDGGAS